MSSHEVTGSRKSAKSPLLTAIGISAAIGIGTTLGSLDAATIEDALTGKWLTRDYTETQQSQTIAIAALENGVGAVTREIDFVATRVGASVRRNETQVAERFAHLDTQIAALQARIAGIANRAAAPAADAPLNAERAQAREAQQNEAAGLRSSLHDLASAHHGAVAEITRRLDRIEVRVGLSTEVTSSVYNPAAKAARRAVAPPKQQSAARAIQNLFAPMPTGIRPERGHIFNVKPISQQVSPLRGSKMPG